MDELILEPYAVVQHWTLAVAGGPWEKIIAAYLEELARRCQAAGRCVIGHIKALALFPGGKFLRVSSVAAHLPASVDGAVPPGCTSLDLTLNVLVYGLERGRIEQIVQETARETAEGWKALVA